MGTKGGPLQGQPDCCWDPAHAVLTACAWAFAAQDLHPAAHALSITPKHKLSGPALPAAQALNMISANVPSGTRLNLEDGGIVR